MLRFLRTWIDPFVVALLATLALGLLVPFPKAVLDVVSGAGDVAVTVLFLVYGMRLSTTEVVAGLRNVRLQGAILAATYLLFPAIGLLVHAVATPWLGTALAAGLLYLTLLPSTVQSSVAFTSIARGNVAGAICAATVSNVAGHGPHAAARAVAHGPGRQHRDGRPARRAPAAARPVHRRSAPAAVRRPLGPGSAAGSAAPSTAAPSCWSCSARWPPRRPRACGPA